MSHKPSHYTFLPAPRRTAVFLIESNGPIRTFASMEEALQTLGVAFIRGRVGPMLYEHLGASHWRAASFVMRDERGQTLTYEDFAPMVEPSAWASYRWTRWWRDGWNGEGPVPGTGRHRHYRFFRHPKTMHEARVNQHSADDVADGVPEARPARRLRNLPNTYDDLPRSSGGGHRNWKHYRKTQYKRTMDLTVYPED